MKEQVKKLAQECNDKGYCIFVGRSSVGIAGKPRVDFKTAVKQMKELLANA